jgi:hypothetical protein
MDDHKFISWQINKIFDIFQLILILIYFMFCIFESLIWQVNKNIQLVNTSFNSLVSIQLQDLINRLLKYMQHSNVSCFPTKNETSIFHIDEY